MKGYLILEDGTTFEGKLHGEIKRTFGEVVFNTSMTGYQEILTDPSYYGQIAVLTYPLIGNYGIDNSVNQSKSIKVRGLVVSEFNNYVDESDSNSYSLNEFLLNNHITCISDIDTRHLTKIIREKGVINGLIISSLSSMPTLIKDIKEYENIKPVYKISTKNIYKLKPKGQSLKRVGVLDFGIKKNILDSLLARGIELIIFPADTDFETINSYKIDGVFLSNGPGDPKELINIIETVKKIIDHYPTFGICLGHQLIALALECNTKKMKFGHRGANQPVKDIFNNRVYITAQNHGYVVEENTIDLDKITITHINVNDNTVEGISHKFKPVFSVQYHPEASPGPKDSDYLFDSFLKLLLKKEA
ncbi:carbamoyl phosphate synthase small subunit [Helicovermis profundi]|uniref:Carbamoyl phosphate synthase small chain n=1 Tax=Helicovermis profundi TaxID=3065157 RepID=A0AAU9E4S3_9FIRM|nr:glutamine-hydrolyzing carbamoyl-phosphate synthase small subunit [Clostridia bacterium S502]